jgi:RNA polymerase sigma-70 factor (ECF subfamily)
VLKEMKIPLRQVSASTSEATIVGAKCVRSRGVLSLEYSESEAAYMNHHMERRKIVFRQRNFTRAAANTLQMETVLQESGASQRPCVDLDRWMERYQQADPEAPAALVVALSPGLLRFFKSQAVTWEQADDLLQETWLRIHRARHTYRPGEPVLPWIYAIARRVRVDGYRRTRRLAAHETAMDILPERPPLIDPRHSLPEFETLIAALPAAQREVLAMLKVGGLTLEEVAGATSSTVGAVKQRAHRAYERLRKLLRVRLEGGLPGGVR